MSTLFFQHFNVTDGSSWLRCCILFVAFRGVLENIADPIRATDLNL
jgi:hypothetical protein